MTINNVLPTRLDKYIYILIIGCFLGSKLLTISIGPQLTIYRSMLIVSPFFWGAAHRLGFIAQSCRPYYKFLTSWTIYSFLLLPVISDLSSFFTYLFFLISALISTYFIMVFINSKSRLLLVLRTFEICALLFSLIGLYEMLTGDYRFVTEINREYYGTSDIVLSTIGLRIPISAFYNPNDFALFLVCSFFVSFFLSRIKNKKLDKLISILITLLIAFLIVATQSRAAFMSLGIGLVIISYFALKNASRSKRIIFFTVVLTFLSTATGWLVANEDLYKELITVDLDEGSDEVRMNLIKNGLVVLKNTFFMGTGIGNIEYHMAITKAYNTFGVTNIHNWWMEVLVSSGIFIFIYYIKIYTKYLFSFFSLTKKKNISKENLNYCLMALCIMLCFVLASISSSSIFKTEWMWGLFPILFTIPSIVKYD